MTLPIAQSPKHASRSRGHRLALVALVAGLLAAILLMAAAAGAKTFEISETSKVSAAATTATVRIGDGTSAYTVAPGGQVTVPVDLVNAANLGSATVLLTYDPAVARAVGCARPAGSPFDGGVCNTGYAQGVVKFNAVASQGVTGTLRFYDIVFQAVSSAAAQTALSLTVESFTDAQGRALTAVVQNGSLAVIGSAAPAVVIRAGTPMQSSFVLTAGLSLDVPVSLQMTGTQQVGAATLLLAYDPYVLRPTRCTAAQPPVASGYCNAVFAPERGLVKLNLLSETGLSGDLRPYTVTFEAAAGGIIGSSGLIPLIEHLTDPAGAPLTRQVVTGTVQVVAGAGPAAQLQVGGASAAFTATHGLTTTVPIWADGVAGLSAATFALDYDPAVVRALRCAIASGIDGGVCALYDGRIQASLITSQGISGAGRLLDVVFTPTAGALPDASSPLTLTVRNLMDTEAGPIPARLRSGVITVTAGGSLAAVALVRVGDGASGGSFTLPIGEQIGVTLTVQGAINLAAATVALGYDPAVVRPLTCLPSAAFGGGACNAAAAPGLVRFNAVAAAPFSGTAALGNVLFQAADGAAVGAVTPLTLTIKYFGGPGGEPLLYQVGAGSLALSAPTGHAPQVYLTAGEGLYAIGIGGLATAPITASVATTAGGLAVATLRLAYDPAIVQPVACELAVEAGYCNLAFAPDQVKLNILSTAGLTGTTRLAQVIFRGLGSGGATPITRTTPLTLTVETLADPALQALTYARQSGMVQVSGVDSDLDGIGNEVEDGAPNGGDGNGDGVPDAAQTHVASLPDTVSGGYVTLVASSSVSLTNVAVTPNPAPSDAPAGVYFPIGFLTFTARNTPVGGPVSITLLLPPTAPAEFYMKYGPTPDGQPAHWYRFDYDGTTGVEIQGNRIVLHFVDGGRGDADLTANGVIQDPGAPALSLPAIAGAVWYDTNHDGSQGGDETTLVPDVTIRIADSRGGVTQTASSAVGRYFVPGLAAGAYTVTMSVPADYAAQTTERVVTLLADTFDGAIDFGLYRTGCVDAALDATFLTAAPNPAVQVVAQVTHGSGAALPAGLAVRLYASGAHVASTTTAAALNLHGSQTVTLTWPVAAPGTYDLTISVGEGAGLCFMPTTIHQTVTVNDLALLAGWNLVSSNADPFNRDLSVVQRTIADHYFTVQTFDGVARSYYPDLPPEFNTLTTLDAAHGYWVKITDPIPAWRIIGQQWLEDWPLRLTAGWNLVSFLPRASLPVTAALQSIAGKFTAVLGFEGGALSYYPDIPPDFNTLQTMKPGLGYWIQMSEAVKLYYPTTTLTAVAGTAGSSDPRFAHPADVIPTPWWTNFYGPAYGPTGAALPVGATVLALDPDGTVCGAIVINTEGRYGLLPCYGDDPTTPADEGALPGDLIRLSLDGRVLGAGRWTARGQRQMVPLGLPYRQYLPLELR